MRAPALLSGLVADAAARAPDAPAFRFLDDTLTHAGLADRAARLAGALRAAGVRRGDRVGLYLRKSLESAVSLYAVMQAGAAYVPLDPNAPPERTRDVLRQCGARVAISHPPKARDAAAALGGAGLEAVIGLPAGTVPDAPLSLSWAEALAHPPAPASAPGASELDLAYIIFTSGSTGAPKGIMHSHGSGLAYAGMAAELYGVRPDDRLSGVSPLHFDMSTFDYFCAPLAGACTTIVSEAHMTMPASLSELAESERLTIWYSVPFALTQMLLHGALAERDLRSLRWVLFGGEPFAPKHLAALTRALPQARFSNVYGPAEVNQCSFHHLPPVWREEDGQPPIGRACASADLLVLADDGAECPPGEAGELAARTPTMMRGYWQRPELNARAFHRQPGAGGVEDVYYRTGDLAVADADGVLRFLGRRDRQVKTRGYRVELDEVEDALSAHQAVEAAAAYAIDAGDGLTLIAAAAVLRPGAAAGPDDLGAFAAGRLPPYARPARIEVLAAFPRTTSGKIDRRALAEAAAARRAPGGAEADVAARPADSAAQAGK